MKNVLNEKPSLRKLNSRMKFCLKSIDNSSIEKMTILDVGCGFGWCALYFLNHGVKKVVGIELSDEDLKAARKIKNSKVKFKIGSGIDIPAKDNSFDTAVCFEVIEHIPKGTEPQLFSEIHRVLKSNGTLYLSTPYNHPLTTVLDPAWWLIQHRHYSLEKLARFGIDAGFNIAAYAVKGGIWSITGLLVMYVSKWIHRRSIPTLQKFLDEKEQEEYGSPFQGIANIFVTYRKQTNNNQNTAR